MKREQLGSRLGFIMLSAGCAIGCGVVWDLSCCRRGAPSAAEMCGNSRGCAGKMAAAALC